MKKVLIILFLFISLFIISKINNKRVEPVSINSYVSFSLEDYNVFYLDLTELNIRTNNILKVLSNMNIITLIPYVNPIYEDKIDLTYNFTSNISNKKNISNFINYYKNTIKEKGFNDDLNYIDIDGIKIQKVKVYGKGIDIYKFIYDNNIRYKTVVNGIYEYLEV